MADEPRRPDSPDSGPAARVRRIIDHCLSQRGKGEVLTDEELLAAHPDLTDELRGELRKLALFARARQRAAEETVAATDAAASPPDATFTESSSATPVEALPAGGPGGGHVLAGLDALPGYELLGELSRGGQGVVYKALQKSTKREVAIKVMRQGPFAGPNDKARFDREVAILGQLKHPHIVAIHDSGAVAGHFYFVMDYISGKPLDRWILESGIGNSGPKTPAARSQSKFQHPKSKLRAALGLFAEICEAVNVAHLRGIIHRDLKPGNVRVDPAGQPHVLDFGLAKLSEFDTLQGSTDSPMTQTGQFVGSLPWSAPEQVAGLPHQIDLRTDVYALGVILYQMLTGGAFPYAVKGSWGDVVDNIRHVEPTPPSRSASVSASRWRIDDEVETIVLKCLNKEQNRRYQTAGELARDVRHYLNHEPIEAKRDSGWYMLKKTVQRHKGVVAALTAILLTLTGSTLALALMYQGQVRERQRAEFEYGRAETARQAESRQRQEAEAARDEAQETAKILEKTLAGAGPSVAQGRDPTILKDMLDATTKRLESGALKIGPEAELRLRWTFGNTYQDIAQDDAYPRAERLLRQALKLARTLRNGDHLDVVTSLNNLAMLLQARGKLAAAEPLYREALEMTRRIHPGDHSDVANGLNNLATLLQARDDPAAEPLYREAVEMLRRITPHGDPNLANSLNNLAVLLNNHGNPAAAEPLCREALEMRQRLFPGDHTDVATSLNNLALVLEDRGDLAAAEPLFREALEMKRRLYPGNHPALVGSLSNLASLLAAQGNLAAAEPLYREALEMCRHLFPNDHSHLANSLSNLAGLLKAQGNLAAAEPFYREALEMRRRLYPGGHSSVAASLNNLAVLLQAQGNFAAAESLFREALEMCRRLFPGDHPAVAHSLNNLAGLLQAQNNLAAAEPLYREALEMRRKMLPAKHGSIGDSANGLGYCLIGLKRFNEAERLLLEAEAIFRQAQGVPKNRIVVNWRALLRLYEAWHAAEPDRGYDAKAAVWRAKLEEWRASTQPASAPAAP